MAAIKAGTHLVIKLQDLEYLTDRQVKKLAKISTCVGEGRKKDGKPWGNNYLVVNTDEPYAADILTMILAGEDAKEAKK